MATKKKAIVASGFAALTPQSDKGSRLSQEELRESMGHARPSLGDLDKIKIPSGGTRYWSIGEEDVKEFEAIIVAAQDVRMWYATKYSGGNEPPDCMSLDLRHGIVGENCPDEITGDCATCPKAQWGTAVNDKGEPTKGKACSERKQMLIFRENDLAPLFMSIPPSSLKEVQGYINRLVPTGEAFWSVVTKFSLRKEKNDSGIDYSQVELEMVRPLTDEELKSMRLLRAQFTETVETTSALPE